MSKLNKLECNENKIMSIYLKVFFEMDNFVNLKFLKRFLMILDFKMNYESCFKKCTVSSYL